MKIPVPHKHYMHEHVSNHDTPKSQTWVSIISWKLTLHLTSNHISFTCLKHSFLNKILINQPWHHNANWVTTRQIEEYMLYYVNQKSIFQGIVTSMLWFKTGTDLIKWTASLTLLITASKLENWNLEHLIIKETCSAAINSHSFILCQKLWIDWKCWCLCHIIVSFIQFLVNLLVFHIF